jgi:hypothetical protein
VILLAEATDVMSGNTPITLTLALLALGGFGAYVAEKVSTRHRLDAQDRVDAAHADAMKLCMARVSALENEVLTLRMTINPPRSGSWPTVPMQVNDR